MPTAGTLRFSAPRTLTVAAINALKPGQKLADGSGDARSGRLKIRKRPTATGVVAEWIFDFQRDGKASRLTIGRYSPDESREGYMTLSQARAAAEAAKKEVREGRNPLHKREIARHEAKVQQGARVAAVREAKDKTLIALLAAYVAALRANGKHDSAYDVENMFSNHVARAFPELAELPAAEVTTAHVSKILARLVGPDAETKKGRTALKVRSYMAAAFKLALGASVDPMAPAGAAGFGLTHNPAAAVPATKMAEAYGRPSERALSVDEFRHYLAHVAAVPSALVRLALQLQIAAGGQRIQQLLRLRHSDVTHDTITLYDPKGKRSTPRRHVLPLVPEVAEIVEMLRSISPAENGTDGYLFASGDTVTSPDTLSEAVHQICTSMLLTEENGKAQASTPFRGGDIRRTVETMLAGNPLRVSKDDRAQLLSHGLTGVQDTTYDKGQHLDDKRAALRKWNDFVADLGIGAMAEGANVVQLRAA